MQNEPKSNGQQPATQGDLNALGTALRADMGTLNTALRTDMSALGTALRADMDTLSTTLRTEMGALSTTLRTEMGALKTELQGDMTSFRSVVAKEFISLRFDLESKMDKLADLITQTRSDVLAACEKAVFKAAKVDHDQTFTRYRLDQLDALVLTLETRRKRRRAS